MIIAVGPSNISNDLNITRKREGGRGGLQIKQYN